MKVQDWLQRLPLASLLLLALSGFSGCVSMAEIPTQAYVPPPSSQLATIFVYRVSATPTKANIAVKVDDRPMATLPDNRFTWIQVPKGKHVVAAGYRTMYDFFAKLELDLEEGHSYILQYDAGMRRPTLLGKLTDPTPPAGVTFVGQYWTRIRVKPESEIPQAIAKLPYVPAAVLE